MEKSAEHSIPDPGTPNPGRQPSLIVCLWQRAHDGVVLLTAASWLAVALVGLTRLSLALVLVGSGVIFLSGKKHLREIRVRSASLDRRDPKYRKLQKLFRTDRRFAFRWIALGPILMFLALLSGSPLARVIFGVIGAALTFFTCVNGIAIGADIAAEEARLEIEATPSPARKLWADRIRRAPLLPGTAQLARAFGKRPVVGEISLGLSTMLLVVACVSAMFFGVAAGNAIRLYQEKGQPTEKKRADPKSESSTKAEDGNEGGALPTPKVKTYAEACPELPDPTVIQHGLGELFRQAGAIAAGCGGPERLFEGVTPIWISEGVCVNELRSLAVDSGYAPVLLYGAPARFALKTAQEGNLLFVDLKKPGRGEVASIGTKSGVYLFARRTPSIRPGNPNASDCTEIGGLARPFAQLRPPLAKLWLEYVQEFGWAWPVGEGATEDEVTFLDYNDPGAKLCASCKNGLCTLSGHGNYRVADEPAFVTLGDLASFMPPPAE